MTRGGFNNMSRELFDGMMAVFHNGFWAALHESMHLISFLLYSIFVLVTLRSVPIMYGGLSEHSDR